jgi:hypothetical protein
MISDLSLQAPASSSSRPIVASTLSKQTLALGKRLVSELELSESVDTLARWMSHHIAELMHDAEQASATERALKMDACRNAIISLWEHRRALPNGQRPFEDLEPILRALESLDPNQKTPRYLPFAFGQVATRKPTDPVQKCLKAATDVDYVARILVRQCLAQAAEGAFDESVEWVALAKAAGLEEQEEAAVVQAIAAEREMATPASKGKAVGERRERIERLRAFAKIAMDMVAELERGFNGSKVRGRSRPSRSQRSPRAKEQGGSVKKPTSKQSKPAASKRVKGPKEKERSKAKDKWEAKQPKRSRALKNAGKKVGVRANSSAKVPAAKSKGSRIKGL